MKAKEALARFAAGKRVTVEWDKRDRYGRIVGKVIADGRDVDLALVREGMCWWYRKYAHEQTDVDRVLYEDAETKARGKGWGCGAIPIPCRRGSGGRGTMGAERDWFDVGWGGVYKEGRQVAESFPPLHGYGGAARVAWRFWGGVGGGPDQRPVDEALARALEGRAALLRQLWSHRAGWGSPAVQ